MDSDILKEYLVKIGVDIPKSEIQKFNANMETFDKGIFGLVKRLNNLLSGWKAVIIAYAAASKKIANFTFDVAKADLETQKWAKHMYLTNDSAKVLSRTLDAMGMQFDDLKDVALNPELYNQYKELIRLGKDLTGGKEIAQALRRVREVSFEFTKFRMTLNYLGERIAYYVSKILDTPAGKSFVKGLKDLNTFLKDNIDTVARKIASFLNIIMRTALRVSQLVHGWIELFKTAYNWLESKIKGLGSAVVAIIGAVGMALLLGPFGKLLLIFQGIMLLLDDYMTYQEGGNYLIPWEKIEVFWEEVKRFFIDFINALKEIIDEMKKIFGIGNEPKPGETYRPGLVESIFRLPAEGLGRLVLPEEDFKELMKKSPSYWNQSDATQKPVTMVFNGSNFTKEDIERGARGNDLIQVRFNQGSFVG